MGCVMEADIISHMAPFGYLDVRHDEVGLVTVVWVYLRRLWYR